MNLDKNSVIPLYYQLADYLREQIRNGHLRPGQGIPSENELLRDFGISRGTIREAMRILIREGMIKRVRGVGTFVATPKIEHETGGITSFTRVMLESGIRPSAEVLNLEYRNASFAVSNALKLPVNSRIVFVKRLRFANAERLMIERSYYRPEIGEKLFNEDLTQSIYTMWQEKYHYNLARSDKTLEVDTVSKEDARLLEIPRGSPVVVLKRLVYFDQDFPVEYAVDTYRADRTVFKFSTGAAENERTVRAPFY